MYNNIFIDNYLTLISEDYIFLCMFFSYYYYNKILYIFFFKTGQFIIPEASVGITGHTFEIQYFPL